MKKYTRFKFAYLLCFLPAILTIEATAQPIRRDSVLSLMRRVADWQINEFALGSVKVPKRDWQNGALYAGLMALNNMNIDRKYDDFLMEIGTDNGWDMGKNRLFADDYCVAQLYTQMYMKHGDAVMIAKWTKLADTIVKHQFNESLKVVPGINLREWAWCDALFMGPPALAYLSTVKKDLKYLNKADTLWWKTSNYLYDQQDHLFYRDSRFFERKEANGQKVYWSRGNGWVMGGLVRMMENMPPGFKNRKLYERQFKEMAVQIASLQQPDGSWHASLLDPATYHEKETSGTGFYCYAIAWGIHNKLLSKRKYLPVVEKAWRAIASAVHPDGKLGYVQNIGDKPVSAGYETTNVYGVGALLLAGTELYKLLP